MSTVAAIDELFGVDADAERTGSPLSRQSAPKVERKIAHLMRRHGGRRARVRGKVRVGQDFSLQAVAINLARLAVLGVRRASATV